MAKTQAATVIIGSASQAASGTTRGRLDCTGVDGGILTFAITNGATPPSAQCLGRVLVAHKGVSMPAAGGEGTGDLDWKQVAEIGGGTSANAKTRGVFRFGPEVAYAEVEFTGNVGQAVTVEAHGTTFSY